VEAVTFMVELSGFLQSFEERQRVMVMKKERSQEADERIVLHFFTLCCVLFVPANPASSSRSSMGAGTMRAKRHAPRKKREEVEQLGR
jgi:hypothetical protein